MFTADNWKDYELIDASDGERLERWNEYILIRPDPQIIWSGERKNPLWSKADGIYRRSHDGGGEWIKKDIPDEWTVRYRDMEFILSPMGFKHTGLFPEQAANWDYMQSVIKNSDRKIKVLNLFAYTGAASVAAAKAGAFVCHVDASKGMTARAKQNAVKSGCGEDTIRFIVDDCIKFVEREARRNSFYDGIILDPPSFGRGPKGEKWVLEEHIDELVGKIAGVLSEKPLFVILNSYTAGLSPSVCGYILSKTVCPRFGGKVESDELGLPVKETGLYLPCGSAARWTLTL
ncbi:MAG: class I SAM-dependent methyltransferase [Eubacteriales bacterium]|nr:class I SAM-dependent methyltransferase [Eubacteriales bacterium]